MGTIREFFSNLILKKGVGPLPGDYIIHKPLRLILGDSSTTVKYPYKQSIWVYSCINAISENIGRVPFVLKKDAGTLEPDIIETGPLYELFQAPNPLMNLEELIKATLIYYCLRGEAFWIIEGRDSLNKIPENIWTFDPARFEPIANKDTGMLMGWRYRGMKETILTTDEVIQFKMFNPYDDLRGLAPIEAAKLSVDQDYHASVYNKAFFENGATVGGIISIPEELTTEQFDRLVNQFNDRHRGSSKAHKIAVVEGGGRFTPARISQKDMDFVEGKGLTRKEILAAYNVNEVVLGDFASVKSFEGSESAHKAFWEECLMPKMYYFENALWSKFFSHIGQRRGKGRIWAEWDTANVGPLQYGFEKKVETASEMFKMGWPINMINKRLKLGMKEVPWGEEWWVPGGYRPVSLLTDPAYVEDAAAGTVPDPPKKDDKKLEFYCSVIEDDFKNKFTKLLFGVRKRSIAACFDSKWDDVLQESDFTKLKDSLLKIYSTSIKSGIASKQREVGFVVPLEEFDEYRETRVEYVVDGFRGFVIEIVEGLRKVNDVEKVRETLNLVSSKINVLAKNEVTSAFTFGENFVSVKAETEIRSLFKDKLITEK